MIFAYNKAHVGDTLLVMMADDKGLEQTVERKFNIAQIKNSAGTIVGWNFFHVSEFLALTGNGAISLTDEQIDLLNEKLAISGFSEKLPYDHKPHFVVGFVESCVPHPDSDHLSITETKVDDGEVLQIVCGAANIREGLKVVVAKPGTMMPDGMLIWPGVLRGVESYGMICSASELALPNAPQKKGILELEQDAVVGSEFKLA